MQSLQAPSCYLQDFFLMQNDAVVVLSYFLVVVIGQRFIGIFEDGIKSSIYKD